MKNLARHPFFIRATPIGCLLLVGSVLAAAAARAYDSSREPAERLPRASESMLLDVTRAGERLVAVGERGHVLLSDDGENWRQAAHVPTRSTLTAVAAAGDGLWAVGHDSVIIASSDGGENWVLQYASPDIDDPELTRPLLDVFFLDQRRGFALGAYALFLGTEDGGTTWRELDLTSAAAGGEDEYDDGADETGEDEVAEDDDYVYETYDDFTDDFVDYHLNAMTRLPDGTLYIAAERGNGFYSSDGGRSWTAVHLPYDGSMFGALAGPAGRLVTFGMRGNVFESPDHGQTWVALETGTQNSLMGGTVTADGTLVIVGASGETLVRAPGAVGFESRPQGEGSDLAAVVAHRGGLIVVGEDGLAAQAIDGGT